LQQSEPELALPAELEGCDADSLLDQEPEPRTRLLEHGHHPVKVCQLLDGRGSLQSHLKVGRGRDHKPCGPDTLIAPSHLGWKQQAARLRLCPGSTMPRERLRLDRRVDHLLGLFRSRG
jgi:hypothetical protein